MAGRRPGWQRPTLILAAVLFVVVAGGGLVYFVRAMMSGDSGPVKQIVQQVQIVRPPPPPPDVEPPPPPPDVQEEVDIPEPQDAPQPADDTPPAAQLGVDAEGAAGGDGFGLLARKGGRDLLAGGGGDAFAWYTGMLRNEILERLQADKRVRASSYKVTVQVWLKPDGAVERVQLAGSSGTPELDRLIEAALAGMRRLSQPPPLEMPQPISLQIVCRT